LFVPIRQDVDGAFSLKGDESLFEVENNTMVMLQNAGVLRKNANDELEFAWIGDLGAGDRAKLKFEALDGNVADGWSKVETLAGDTKVASSIWQSLELESSDTIKLDELASVPELQPNWSELSQILKDKMAARTTSIINRSMLASALSEVGGKNVSLAGVFNSVTSNLRLGPREIRLIGHTDQKLDQTKYNPDATQANNNLLVVDHLRHAEMPGYQKDQNAVSDFIRGRSNIDQESEENFIDTES
jgi:hypothetical protein